ncbi:acyl-CoA thioesterase [Sporolactobacillus sp. THM7-4]|nr:acyl-CoA thioesterase [Sporolactobacillus sp. THM7-4]
MIKTRIPVRFCDCDAMGHVNNAVYFTYFEEGKREIFRWFTPSMDTRDWHVIAASNHCDYIREINYGSDITVYTWISTISRSSFDVEHAICDDEGNWHARGRVTLVGYNYDKKQVEPLSETIKAVLRKHQDGPEDVPELRQIRGLNPVKK